MTDKRRSRARARLRDGGAGFDVWLPALVALIAAIVMVYAANAQTAAPRPIYDAERFAMSEAERTALERQAAASAGHAVRLTATPVEMRPLAPLYTAEYRAAPTGGSVQTAVPGRHPPVVDRVRPTSRTTGWERLLIALFIASLLGGALCLLDRTWRRTGPAARLDYA